jgi:hypothetical protein
LHPVVVDRRRARTPGARDPMLGVALEDVNPEASYPTARAASVLAMTRARVAMLG